MLEHCSNECTGEKPKILSKMKLWQNSTWGQTQNVTNYKFLKLKWQQNSNYYRTSSWTKNVIRKLCWLRKESNCFKT